MSNKKATKRALLTSILAICLCLVMLIGSTFAWFTDTASTGVNQIKSGTLKVDIVKPNVDANGKYTSLEGAKLEFQKVAAASSEAILWEPGCTYVTEGFKIKNDGTLALKWKAEVNKDNVTNGKASDDAKDGMSLLDVIDFYVVTDNTSKDAQAVSIDEFVGNLEATKLSDKTYYIMGHMKEEAGNDYQGLTLENISITVYATQDTVENDSFDNTYDEKATYPVNVKDAAGLKAAAAVGGTITLVNDITQNESLEIKGDSAIILNEKTVANTTDIWNDGDKDNGIPAVVSLLSIENGASVTISGNGTIAAKKSDCYAINVVNGDLTIENGTFIGNISAVQVEKGTLTIKGGTFSQIQESKWGDKYLLNCIDSAYKNGTAKIIVTGGTFVNFDPSNNTAEGPNTNFLADGYKVTSETQSNGDIWYTVVPKA